MTEVDIIDWEEPEYTRQRFTQDRGPTLQFAGRLLASATYEAGGREAFGITIEVWETAGGALIGVNKTKPLDREGFEAVRAVVIEPGGDEQAGHFAIMDLFEWHDRARSMVRKTLKWSLTRKVA